MRALNNPTRRLATAMPSVLAFTATPVAAGVTSYWRARVGKMACAANRSTKVRNAVRPMTAERRSAAPGRDVCIMAIAGSA
jgi:hypothetical protein